MVYRKGTYTGGVADYRNSIMRDDTNKWKKIYLVAAARSTVQNNKELMLVRGCKIISSLLLLGPTFYRLRYNKILSRKEDYSMKAN